LPDISVPEVGQITSIVQDLDDNGTDVTITITWNRLNNPGQNYTTFTMARTANILDKFNEKLAALGFFAITGL
jgi:hypothetical protein